ncbi:hypothetical protein JNO53_02460 [Altererythrobacter sp. C41]|nr:hypothetical protein [Altererythrobacter sp. C41]
MSFSDRPTLTVWQMAGCFAYMALGALITFTGLIGAALGDCASSPGGYGCRHDGLVKFAMFPGTLIVILAGGILLARHMMKDRD